MNIQSLLSSLDLREDKDFEFKAARGGLPSSVWESYSAMANTDGGVIVLGVKELDDGHFEVSGVPDVLKIEKDFWNAVNNRSTVSANLLNNHDLQVMDVQGKKVIVLQIPRAGRRQRPVYVGQNPLNGTHRRFNDGDYKCTPEEVGRMLADQSDQSADSRVLPGFDLSDVDLDSLRQYRNRFSARNMSHAWLNEENIGFLRKLGGWGRSRETGQEGLTVAGLLMFGNEDSLNDQAIGLKYHVDYRERVSNSIADRWLDRVTIDGTWVPNLFQFFQRVYPKLSKDLKLPFTYKAPDPSSQFADPLRSGMPPAHEAIQEALVNALIHADYRGQGGIIIEKFMDRLELSNPGILLVSYEQMRLGAVSECRNPMLQRMFQMMGAGDKAGSGLDKIRLGWQSQHWRWPMIQEIQKPDRVKLTMPMVSLLPEESLQRLRSVLGENLSGLNGREVQALVMAEMEGCVTNQRLQQFTYDHTADITKLLQDLVFKGFLIKVGYGRWASYRLSPRLTQSDQALEEPPDITDENSGYKSRTPDITNENSGYKSRTPDITDQSPGMAPEINPTLLAIGEPARNQKRIDPSEMQRLIRLLCENQYLTFRQIATILNREPNSLQRWTLRPMSQEKQLILAYPDPTHPKQAYKTNPDWKES